MILKIQSMCEQIYNFQFKGELQAPNFYICMGVSPSDLNAIFRRPFLVFLAPR